MSVSLGASLVRPACHAGTRSSFLPTRSGTRLKRGRPLLHASPLSWKLGSSRKFSWNPFGGVSKAEVPTQKNLSIEKPTGQSFAEENVSRIVGTDGQSIADSSLVQSDPATSIGVNASDLLSDALSDTAATLASHPIPTQYGDMAALGLVSWTPAGFFPWLLEVVQVSTGLPWWSTIVLTTVGARAVLLPLIIRSNRMQARLAPLQPKLTELRDQANKARADGDMFLAQHTMQSHMKILKNAKVNPFDSLVTAATQMCVQIGFFLGIRRMCQAPVEQFKEGGFGWITDLTAADPYYILPILNFALMNLQLTASRRDMLAVGSPSAPHLVNGLRILTLFSIPLVATFPAALNLHFISSITFITVQTLTLRVPAVRRAVDLPPLPPVTLKNLPTFKDSLQHAREWMRRRAEEARVKEEDRRRKMRMMQKSAPPRR